MNPLYPIYLKLAGRAVLVAGGGPVALRRIQRLVAAGASVRVVSPNAVAGVVELRNAGKIHWSARKFEASDLEGVALCLLATGDEEVARSVREEATRRGILLNTAEVESLSDFHVPALATRGDVQIAVSTGGQSPAGAARLRAALEAWLEKSAESIDAAVALGRAPGASSASRKAAPGKVYIVGAGPGDPGLLTLRAAELIASADVILHDRLVSRGVLDLASPNAQLVFVGKEAGCPREADIERLLVECARAAKAVVRLKGGDPLLFARGGEEIAALRVAGVEFEVVPGVSALTAAPGAAGIPLTLRGTAREVIVRSGHPGEPDPGPPTYVYFMAGSRLAQVAAELAAEGLPPSTPVAIIQRGTLPDQRTLTCVLGSLAALGESSPIETPALVVVGEVARFADASLLAPLLDGLARPSECVE